MEGTPWGATPPPLPSRVAHNCRWTRSRVSEGSGDAPGGGIRAKRCRASRVFKEAAVGVVLLFKWDWRIRRTSDGAGR